MKNLTLKYNLRFTKDPFPRIQEMAEDLGLKIESQEEETRGSNRSKVIRISGDTVKLHQLDRQLVRFASIRRRIA